jgi:acyl carrier protein
MTPEQLSYIERRAQTLGRVRAVLIEALHIQREPDELDADAPLFGTGLALDSVDAVELVVSVETAFGVPFPEGAGARPVLRTLNTLVDHLLRASSGASPHA